MRNLKKRLEVKRLKNSNALVTDRLVDLPVSNLHLELSVLHILLFYKHRQKDIIKLELDDFYNYGTQLIYKEFKRIVDDGKVIDPATIHMGILGLPTYKDVVGANGFDSDLDRYIAELKKIAQQRKIQRLSYDATVKVKEGKDPLEIRSWQISELEKIKAESFESIKEQNYKVNDELMAELERYEFFGIDCGYTKLDFAIRGFTNGTLTIVGGTPGVGKTTWLLNIVNHVCKKGEKVLYVSLEMSYSLLQMKLISIMTGIPTSVMMSTRKNIDENSWKEITRALNKLATYKLYRLGKSETTVIDIENTINTLGGFDIIFVDYLQLLSSSGQSRSRYEAISDISRSLKKLSTKHNIPIIVVASINRAYKDNPDKKPSISDLRDSGNIEYDADTILFLHRASAFRDYDDAEDEMTSSEFEHHAELIIAKNRYGMANKSIDFYFDGEKSIFREMEV